MGLDHLIVPYKSGGGRLDDCDVELPDTTYASSLQGNATRATAFIDGLRLGLYAGPSSGSLYPDGKAPRLQRVPSSFAGWQTRQVAGVSLDNRPLWEFLSPNIVTGVPASCQRSAFNPGTKAKMQSCIGDYISSGSSVPLFTAQNASNPSGLYDIQLSPRLAFVPTLMSCCPDGALDSAGQIQSFNLIFLQTLYIAGGGESGQFNPGEGTSNLSVTDFKGVSALTITDKMVPQKIIQSGPNGSLRGTPLNLVG
jgi:hypothetical protein